MDAFIIAVLLLKLTTRNSVNKVNLTSGSYRATFLIFLSFILSQINEEKFKLFVLRSVRSFAIQVIAFQIGLGAFFLPWVLRPVLTFHSFLNNERHNREN